jgi:membrane associated rhomboid family serine protease
MAVAGGHLLAYSPDMTSRSPGRHPAPAWLRPFTERLSPTIRNLVVVNAVLFGLYVMAAPLRAPLANHLALGSGIMAGEVWQPLTALFVHTGFLYFFFNMLGLWFVGATIERIYGQRRFLLLFFGTGLIANLVLTAAIAVQIPLAGEGCGNSVLALFVALGVAYGRTPIRVWGQLVLQARVLAWIFVGMSVIALLVQGAWIYLLSTLTAVALAYILAGGKPGPLLSWFASPRGKRRTGFDVLDGGRGKSSKRYLN